MNYPADAPLFCWEHSPANPNRREGLAHLLPNYYAAHAPDSMCPGYQPPEPVTLADTEVDRIAERLADRLAAPQHVPNTHALARALARVRYSGLPPWDDLDPRQHDQLRNHQLPEARLIHAALTEVPR